MEQRSLLAAKCSRAGVASAGILEDCVTDSNFTCGRVQPGTYFFEHCSMDFSPGCFSGTIQAAEKTVSKRAVSVQHSVPFPWHTVCFQCLAMYAVKILCSCCDFWGQLVAIPACQCWSGLGQPNPLEHTVQD